MEVNVTTVAASPKGLNWLIFDRRIFCVKAWFASYGRRLLARSKVRAVVMDPSVSL